MAKINTLTDIDKGLLFSRSDKRADFGKALDYVEVAVEEDGVLLEYFNVSVDELNIDGSKIDLDIGQHLRDNGYDEGIYKVTYNFFRPVIGSTDKIYVDLDNIPTSKEVSEKIINGESYFYVDNNGQQQTVNEKTDSYVISDVSPSSTELSIVPQNIDDIEYQEKINNLAIDWKYYPVVFDREGVANTGYKFNSEFDDTTITAEISETDKGFEDSLIGKELVIEGVYSTTEPYIPFPSEIDVGFDKDFEATVTFGSEEIYSESHGQPESPYTDEHGDIWVWTIGKQGVRIFRSTESGQGDDDTGQASSTTYNAYWRRIVRGSADDDQSFWILDTNIQPGTTFYTKVIQGTQPFVSKIVEVLNDTTVKVQDTWDTYREALEKGKYTVTSAFSSIMYNNGYVTFPKLDLDQLNIFLVHDNNKYLVLNSFKNRHPSTAVSLKLYSPIEDSQGLSRPIGEYAHFVQQMIPPITDTIKVVPYFRDTELDNSVFLALPNIDGEDIPFEQRGTDFKTYDNLVGSDSTVVQELEDKLVSGSLLDVKLNIDYQKRLTSLDEYNDNGFGNFINFSGAEERLRNFKYKLDLIESYTSHSGNYDAISSSTDTTNYYSKKITEVKNSFDHYEYYLYHESSSYISSSAGEFHDTSWPKENSSSPYTLAPTTASVASTWFDTMIESASLYDQMNDNRLVNNLPGHVQFDDEGKVFLEFMDMIGQQFDESWIYVKHLTDINDRRNNFSKGISKDIVKHVAKASGLEVVNGNDLLNLSEYLLGKDIDDGSQTYEKAQEEVTEEIWKRILANLPFFQRTKGTTRAIKGLLNCYGIPSSILRVREYGGPDYDDLSITSHEIGRNFTYALDFRSSQYIEHLWTTDNTSGFYPQTMEFRFRSPERQDQTIIQKGNDWAISLQDSGTTNKGYLRFAVSASTGVQYITSSLQQFYNDEMWSVMLTRKSQSGIDLASDSIKQNVTYELVTKQYDATRFKINYQTSESLDSGIAAAGNALNAAFTSSAQVYIGGSGSAFDGNNFSGSMMEYRLWTEALTSSSFDNHVKTPKAYNGNTTSSHADNLVFRLTFDENIDLTSEYVSSSVDNTSYSARSGSQTTFTSNQYRSINEVEEMKVPNIGASRRNSNKIRIEDGYLTGSLAPDVTLQKSSFDFAPVDSNKLGVYFSPTDVIDKDIIYSLADVNYDNYIGDPRDQYEDNYRELDNARQQYWKKYPKKNNFFDYLRILQYYDSGIFKQMESLLPARAKSTLGVLVEPNILNRNKAIIGDIPEYESLYFENAGEFQRGISPYHTSSIEKTVITTGAEYTYYESETSVNRWIPESGSVGKVAMPSVYSIDKRLTNEWGNSFATASITSGDIALTFQEALQPVITASRMSEHNKVYEYYFSSSADAKAHPSNGTDAFHIGALSGSHYSWSLQDSDYQTLAYDSTLFRSFFAGTKLGDDLDDPNYPAVSVTLTSPTRLVTVDPGESRLVEDSKVRPRDTGFIKGEDLE